MKRAGLSAVALILAGSLTGYSQNSSEGRAFSIAGHPGSVQIFEANGKSYVSVEDLARLIQGTLSFNGNMTVLAVSGSQGAPSAPAQKGGFSREFLAAAIEDVSTLREWRITVVDTIQNNAPVPEDWIAGLRRQADQKLAFAAAARSTNDDRNLYSLLVGVSANLRKLSDKYLNLRRQLQLVRPDDITNDRLDRQIITCGKSLTAMVADNQFHDEPACLEAR
jgi:hypothetical protein